MTWSGGQSVMRTHESQQNLEENKANFVVTIVPADGLAPVGARTSAGTVMT